MLIRYLVAVAITFTLFFAAGRAIAGSKEECLDAHGRGQDLREKGQLSRARQSFMACAQSACPPIVQADCARFGEELAHLLPTVSFAARDASAADLPATSVYVDDVLVTTRLDDGRTYEIDPGKHTVRYVHDGRETTIKAVVNQGEKGRTLVATFPALSTPAPHAASETFEPVIESRRSAVPLVVAGFGAAAAITGGILVGIGMTSVPSTCSMSTNECATPPDDPALAEAHNAVSLTNTGIGVGVVGAALLVGGVVWYMLQPTQSVETRRGQRSNPFRLAF